MILGSITYAQVYQAIEEQLEGVFSSDTPYSPYVNRNFPERPLWGDSHLHTALSTRIPQVALRFPAPEAR